MGEWINFDFRERVLQNIQANDLNSHIHFSGILLGEEKWRAIEKSHLLLHFTE